MMKKVKLAVTEFALPSPRRGSIELYSGLGRGAELGVEIHQAIQIQRMAEHPNYRAEVLISKKFEWGDYCFEVSGRIDGLYEGESSKIEEIKSCFNTYELLKKLKEAGDDHPYILQIQTYAYLFWLENNHVPELNLHLVSSRNGESIDYKVGFNIARYEEWLHRRSQELVAEAKLSEKRAVRRRKAAADLVFPFEFPRSGQAELISTIESGMREERPMLIQAPTGLGKTLGVLFPVLKESLIRAQKVVYLTPKNSQHSVAEDAVRRIQEKGAKVKALTITAKSKMCFKSEPLCNPDFCEYAKDHYTKVEENKVIEELSKKRGLTAKKFKATAEKYQVCPFEIQLDAAKDADVVICDYNYVFAPRSAFGRLASSDLAQEGKPNLVIDEAHNLPSRSMDYYSPSLSVSIFEKMLEDVSRVSLQFRQETIELIKECMSIVKQCGNSASGKAISIQPPVSVFLEQDEKLRGFLTSYLNSDVEIEPRDVVLRLCFYWSEFAQALEFIAAGRDEFFTSFHPSPAQIKITCCDASEMLRSAYDDYAQVVAFSATLKPFDFYQQLSGLPEKELKTAEFVSPFPKSKRKLLIIPQVSSKYSARAKNYPRIAEVIQKVSALKKGNYFVFFPSFDFMEKVFQETAVPSGFDIIKQERGMRQSAVDDLLEELKDGSKGRLIFAVQGGVFSEGVDYPGDMIIGAFVIGPPLPSFDFERERMKDYYQNNYASGFDYAYTFPAMAKAVQAAGRVIRSESDRGLIILMDSRFIQPSFSKSMPQDWYNDSPMELVSQRILSEIAEFWALGDQDSSAPLPQPDATHNC